MERVVFRGITLGSELSSLSNKGSRFLTNQRSANEVNNPCSCAPGILPSPNRQSDHDQYNRRKTFPRVLNTVVYLVLSFMWLQILDRLFCSALALTALLSPVGV